MNVKGYLGGSHVLERLRKSPWEARALGHGRDKGGNDTYLVKALLGLFVSRQGGLVCCAGPWHWSPVVFLEISGLTAGQ